MRLVHDATGRTLRRAAGGGVVAGFALLVVLGARAQGPSPPRPADGRFAGIDWQFVRVRYHYRIDDPQYSFADFGEPWYIDAPAADENFSQRVRAVTAIRVTDPIVVAIDDPNLFLHPWIYFVEPGNLQLSDHDAATLREYLLRGGTATFDDFHGPREWNRLAGELGRVFPGRPIVDLVPPHPVFSCFYTLDHYPQVPGLGSFLAGRTWEKGGVVAHLRTILDDAGRPMVFINWNTDMGDGWEWSNSVDYPGYVTHSADAYRMGMNEVIFALTH